MEPASPNLTSRDFEILEVLTQKVRTLSVPQIARTWWKSPGDNSARRKLSELEVAGLISRYSSFCHPEIYLGGPVISWMMGQSTPDFGAASYRLKSRWRASPTLLTFVSATAAAGNFFGGSGGRASRETEQSHDLHLASVFLRIRTTRPDDADKWISEDIIRRTGTNRKQRIPDAVIDRGSGKHVVEFGGAYGKRKLARFHSYCSEVYSSYEVW